MTEEPEYTSESGDRMEFHADIESHIGPPKEVTDEIIQACREKGQSGSLLFDLYREAGGLLTVTSAAYLAGIPHIKLPGPNHLTIFDESHGSITHEPRQPSHQAHATHLSASWTGVRRAA